jgi:hypothetical protein
MNTGQQTWQVWIGTFALALMSAVPAAAQRPAAPGPAPVISDTRLALTSCTIDLRQDWVAAFTKLQFDVWNEDEVKFTGAFECSDGWHETQLAGDLDAGAGTFSLESLGTPAARFRVQGVTSSQCPDARATGTLAVQSYRMLGGTVSAGTTLAGAGKSVGSIRWDPAGVVPEGGVR